MERETRREGNKPGSVQKQTTRGPRKAGRAASPKAKTTQGLPVLVVRLSGIFEVRKPYFKG